MTPTTEWILMIYGISEQPRPGSPISWAHLAALGRRCSRHDRESVIVALLHPFQWKPGECQSAGDFVQNTNAAVIQDGH